MILIRCEIKRGGISIMLDVDFVWKTIYYSPRNCPSIGSLERRIPIMGIVEENVSPMTQPDAEV